MEQDKYGKNIFGMMDGSDKQSEERENPQKHPLLLTNNEEEESNSYQMSSSFPQMNNMFDSQQQPSGYQNINYAVTPQTTTTLFNSLFFENNHHNFFDVQLNNNNLYPYMPGTVEMNHHEGNNKIMYNHLHNQQQATSYNNNNNTSSQTNHNDLNKLTSSNSEYISSSMSFNSTTDSTYSQGDDINSRIIEKDELPNPRKIIEILRELESSQLEMNILKDSVGKSSQVKRERNRVASRTCRLKKKASFEVNKVKVYHLNKEFEALKTTIKELCNFLLQNGNVPNYGRVYTKYFQTVKEKYLPERSAAGNLDSLIDDILKNFAVGKDPEIYRNLRNNN